MGHYAKVTNGKVVKVIVAEASFFSNFVDDSPGKWIQTSYNTRGGVHYQANSNEPSPTLVTMIINDSTSSFADEDAMYNYTASLLESFTSSSIEFSSSLSDPELSGSIEAPIYPVFGETGSIDQSKTKALRGNYAGVGYTYDSTLDAFYAPQPYTSWVLNTGSFLWESPVAYPTGDITGSYTGSYQWSESELNWVTSSIG
jgi:hypothetical protein